MSFDISENIFFFDIETGDSISNKPQPRRPLDPIRSITFQRLSDGKIWHFNTRKINSSKVIDMLGSKKWLSENTEGVEPKSIDKDRLELFWYSGDNELEGERKLFEWTNSFLSSHEVAILSAHYSDFDELYMLNRPRILKKNAIKNNVNLEGLIPNINFGTIKIIDYMEMFARLEQTSAAVLGRIALDWMSKKTNGYGKIQRKGIDEMWRDNPEKLTCYNIWDDEILYRTENKRNLFNYYFELTDYSYTYLDSCFSAMKIAETTVMYKTNPDIIWITRDDAEAEEIKIGGRVLEPASGLFKNVFEFDNSKEYPFIIMSLGLDPMTKLSPNTDKKNISILPSGRKYDMNKNGILTEILQEKANQRNEYRKMMFDEKKKNGETDKYKEYQNKEKSIKSIMNGFYGQLASGKGAKSRMMDGEIGTDVTQVAGIHNTYNKVFLEHIKIYIENNKIIGYSYPDVTYEKKLHHCLPDWILDGMEKRPNLDTDERLKWDKKYFSFIENFFKKEFKDSDYYSKGKNTSKPYELKTIYGDTDSNKCIFNRDIDKLPEELVNKMIDKILKILKNSFKDFMSLFLTKENKIYLKTKLEGWFDWYYQWGSKKRYVEVEHLTKEEKERGIKPVLTYLGVETRRRNASKFCKETLKGFFERLLIERQSVNELRKFLISQIKLCKSGKIDDKLGKPIKISSSGKGSYITQQWKSAMWSNKNLGKNFDIGNLVILYPIRSAKEGLKSPNGVCALEWGDNPKDYDLNLDYNEIIRRDIIKTFNYIVRGFGYSSYEHFMKKVRKRTSMEI